MTTRIEVSMDEVREIAREAIALAGGNNNFDSFGETMKFQAVAGVFNIIVAMQNMGYRIARPLKEVFST